MTWIKSGTINLLTHNVLFKHNTVFLKKNYQQIAEQTQGYFLRHCIQTDSGSHTATYPVKTGM
jgi:hypothetical protein